MTFSVAEGLLLAVAALLVTVSVRFLVALARGEPADDALSITGRWTAGIAGAAFAAGGVGLVQLADAVGMLTMFVGSHPLAVSNGLVAGLGAFVAGGFLELSAPQYLGLSVALVGATMLLYEVAD